MSLPPSDRRIRAKNLRELGTQERSVGIACTMHGDGMLKPCLGTARGYLAGDGVRKGTATGAD
jgi:hypothetical protein